MSVLKILFWKHWEYVPLILCNYIKLNMTKLVWFIIFFYFKCGKNLNGKCTIVCIKSKKWLLNMTSLHKFLGRITKKTIKYLLLVRYKPKVRKKACTATEKAHSLLIISKKIFLEYPNLIKINSGKRVCLRKYYRLILIKNALKLL